MSQYPPPPDYNSVQGYPNAGYGSNEAYPPPQGAYPPPQGAYPPPQGAYPPSQGAYPPPQGAYPPPQSAYPPPQHGYRQQIYGEPTMGQVAHSDAESAVPKASDDHTLFKGSFSDKAIRRAFIRKVYLILFAQLLVTFGFVCLFIFVNPVKKWVQRNVWFYVIAYVLFLVLYIVLICCPSVRRKYPGNFICLSVFTLAFSYMAGVISSFHDTEIVLMAAGITAAVCLAISIFAIQTKIDFTMCSGLLFALVMVLFFFGIACLITGLAWGGSYIMSCVYGGLAALVFSLFLIYDTQQVMGGRKYEISEEEYIYGALQLYIDVVYIFIIILGFAGNSK